MFAKFILQPFFILIVHVTISLRADDESVLSQVRLSCSNKLNFKSIPEFKTFMGNLRQVTNDISLLDGKDATLLKCIEDKDSLFALEELLASYDRRRPCKFSEIAKLEEYVRKWLMTKRRPLSMKFFTLFGVNVGYHCKRNLLAHLKQADSEVDDEDFIYSMASPAGWDVLINEMTKKSMKFGGSSHAGSSVINRIAQLVPGLAQIEQLDYLIFNHPMNKISSEDWSGQEVGVYKAKDSGVVPKLVEYLDRIIESCVNLERLYLSSVLSLARLNALGLVVRASSLDSHHEHSTRLHKWLAAASFCQVMVRVKATAQEGEIGLRVEHDDKSLDSRRKQYSYVAEFDDISKEAQDSVWLAGVPESRWFQRSEAVFREEADDMSVAMSRLKQFIKGLERDHEKSSGAE